MPITDCADNTEYRREKVMTGNVIGCATYALIGLCFIGFGILLIAVRRDKPVGFWAGVKELPKVEDINGYNAAVGKLWCAYGAILALLGLFLLNGVGGWILTILGTCWASIGLAVVYSVVILKKFEKK